MNVRRPTVSALSPSADTDIAAAASSNIVDQDTSSNRISRGADAGSRAARACREQRRVNRSQSRDSQGTVRFSRASRRDIR
jgi:hypothetical protein